MTLEQLINWLSSLRRRPSLFKALKKLGFPINREEFRHLCATQSVTVNAIPRDIDTRLHDGVSVIEVNYGDQVARFWLEIQYKRIIRMENMRVDNKGELI